MEPWRYSLRLVRKFELQQLATASLAGCENATTVRMCYGLHCYRSRARSATSLIEPTLHQVDEQSFVHVEVGELLTATER